MNRHERRRSMRHIRHITDAAVRELVAKHSHRRIIPQACVLYVPAMRGYLEHFSPTSFRTVEFPHLARHYTEDEVTSAALTFRELTGLQVAVRPYYGSSREEL